MLGKFHNIEYDGVVLKIPTSFIKINKLENVLEEFLNKLKECDLCMYMPDNQNNIYELENYRNKEKKISDISQAETEKQNKANDYRKKLLNKEVYELEYKNVLDSTGRYSLLIGDISYSVNDVYTNKYNVKASFLKKYHETVDTYDKFVKFASDNFPYLYGVLLYSSESLSNWRNIRFSADMLGNFKISLSIYHIKINVTENKNRIEYNITELQEKNGVYGYYLNRDIPILLNGYIKQGLKLIKE